MIFMFIRSCTTTRDHPGIVRSLPGGEGGQWLGGHVFPLISTYLHTEFYVSMTSSHSSKNALKVSEEPPLLGPLIIGLVSLRSP